MAIRIEDIFSQKFNEIQSRLPVRMNGGASEASFQDLLDNASSSINNNDTSNYNNTGLRQF